MQAVNDMISDLLNRILKTTTELCDIESTLTITSRSVQTSVRLLMNSEVGRHAIAEGTKAVVKFIDYKKQSNGGRVSENTKAGLTVSVSKIRNFLKSSRLNVSSTAPVYLAAVAEYIAAEILELAGNVARDNHRARIIPRHINIAIRGDEELDTLFKNGIIARGGVMPSINSALLDKSRMGGNTTNTWGGNTKNTLGGNTTNIWSGNTNNTLGGNTNNTMTWGGNTNNTLTLGVNTANTLGGNTTDTW